MNMNQTRLDDRLNSLIVAAAVFGTVLTSALTFQMRAAAEAPVLAHAELPTVIVIAQR